MSAANESRAKHECTEAKNSVRRIPGKVTNNMEIFP